MRGNPPNPGNFNPYCKFVKLNHPAAPLPIRQSPLREFLLDSPLNKVESVQKPPLADSWEVGTKPQAESYSREALHFSHCWHKVQILGHFKVTLYGGREIPRMVKCLP